MRYHNSCPDYAKFIVRGVAYQVRDTQNPIADDRLPELERDVALFKELGLNTVYVCKWTPISPCTPQGSFGNDDDGNGGDGNDEEWT